jgi:carboxyl-terminal processing protease
MAGIKDKIKKLYQARDDGSGVSMKKLFVVFLLFAAANIFITYSGDQKNTVNIEGGDTLKYVEPESYHSNIEKLVNTILSRYHYKKTALNDSLSGYIYTSYLKTLDNSRCYFIQSDIDEFAQYRDKIDDYIIDGQLEPVYEIFNRFRDRVKERTAYVDKILNNEIDFTKDEYLEVDREDVPWPATTEEANEIWRKRVKNDALNLKLAGKEWKDISETLKKRYDNFNKNVLQYKSEDVFQLFMNAYTEAIDPHTNYMSPVTTENFKIDMQRSLEGIGAQLKSEDEYTKIAEVITGGPAFKSGQLAKEDKIVGVAQGDDGEMVDVVGWRLTDVVQLIRGPKGTKVRLQVQAAKDGANAIPKTIELIREKVTLEEQSAKKDVFEIENGGKAFKIGIIEIPAFYSDFEAMQKGDPNYKSTTRDVKKLIAELKKDKVDGILIDLRHNGGGSLQEAIQLSGLFIKDGPVVQVKNADGSIDVGDDPDPEIIYDGPLAVVVDRLSASASEIFAGAIQDYGRGLIIGAQTFGKGTVQNLIDLNRLMPNKEEKYGQIKLTVAKYYRITGGSTQHLGVVPDIDFPSVYDPEVYGESAEKSALPYDQIKSSDFKPYSNLKKFIPELEKKHELRVSKNEEFDYLLEDIEKYKESKEKKRISLNESVRKKEREAEEEKDFQRENKRREKLGLKLLKKGETATDMPKEKDFMIDESARILSDFIALNEVG